MFIYLIQNKETGHFKIGRTKNIKNRMRQLQTGSSGELVLVDKFESDFASKLESYLHNIYNTERKPIGHEVPMGCKRPLTLGENILTYGFW